MSAERHDHKGYSEEKCLRCGWVMGQPPLNCNNDDTPHRFPSTADAIALLADMAKALRGAAEHITEDLQPEFQRLADGHLLTWPRAWRETPYDESMAAQRLATWWHGAGLEDLFARLEALCGDER